jgi:hypothetical protein
VFDPSVYAAITASHAKCCQSLDAGDVEGYVGEFTEDCVVDLADGHHSDNREDLARWRRKSGPATHIRHLAMSPVVHVTDNGSSAHAVTPVLVVNVREQVIRAVVTYRSRFRRVENRWLIERHEVVMESGR